MSKMFAITKSDLKQRVIKRLKNDRIIEAIKNGIYDPTFEPFYSFKDQDCAELILVRVFEKMRQPKQGAF